MTNQQTRDWYKTIDFIKREYPCCHLTYPSTEGWVNVSYKQSFLQFKYYHTRDYIVNALRVISKAA